MSGPDNIVAKDAGGGFAPHSEGQFAMLCVDVVDLGIKVEQYPGSAEIREAHKVALVFASGERNDDKDKSLTIVTTEMTVSMNEKANLRKFLESWRGKSYTADAAEKGIAVTKLYGQPALISIEHVTTRKGRKFAKITSVAPLPKAVAAPEKDLLAAYARPKFLTDRRAEYAEAVKKHRATLQDAPDADWPGDELPPEDEADDIPF